VKHVTADDADFADAAFQAQLEALRQHYLQEMPARRALLIEAWRGCTDGGDEAAWMSLRDVAHKLSGSAPCYGLDALGDAARDVDRLLSGRPPCRERARLEAVVIRMQELVDAAIPPA
jgi:hypothetical protein